MSSNPPDNQPPVKQEPIKIGTSGPKDKPPAFSVGKPKNRLTDKKDSA